MAGYVLYEGPSRIDGSPIVVIATDKTKNRKTGPMIQTWILRADISPMAAINTGDDASVCGGCPLRGLIVERNSELRNAGRTCYVNVAQAPNAVWKAYKRGVYPKYERKHADFFRGKLLRLGAYGDPVAAPLTMWKPLIRLSKGRTGYTHQWRDRKFARWSKYIMASIETVGDAETAHTAGWRTFRSRWAHEPIEPSEIVCPASEEGGARMTCADCTACKGGRPEQRSIVIIAHGSPSKMASYSNMRESL